MLDLRGRIWWCLVLAGGTLCGCVTRFDTQRQALTPLYAQGRFDEAARLLDSQETLADYGERNRLLWWLERGSIASALHQPAQTIDLLEKAEAYMETHREPTGSDQFGRWLLNDTVTPYFGEPYEDLYVNVFKLLAQLEQGAIQGGATVEARRLAGKADVLRDRYVRTEAALRERESAEGKSAPVSARFTESVPAGEFIESPLGTYLTGVTFMKSGDRELQSVAGRRLQSSIELQGRLVGDVEAARFADLGERTPDSANVLIVGLSGRGPTKVAERIGPIPIYTWPVYFELPLLVGGSAEVGGVRVVVDPIGGSGGGATVQTLDVIEDLRSVATENHRRELPQIYARTYLRSSLKAAAAFAATEVARSQTRGGGNRDLVTIGGILAGLALVAGTEKADLRCWTFLPGRADVGLLKLPAGRHVVRLEYLGRGGGVVYTTPGREIVIEHGGSGGGGGGDAGLVTVVERYWR